MVRPAVLFDVFAGLLALAALFLVSLPETAPVQPWLKAAPALVWALSFAVVRGPAWGWGLCALLFAALGDFLLAGGQALVMGAGAFAAMQILYAFRFWDAAARRPAPRRGSVAAPLIFGALALLVLGLTWSRLGELAPGMAVYAALLATMASGAVASGQGWRLALGGALFFLSDGLIVVFLAWPGPSPWASWAILVPYYLSQSFLVPYLRDQGSVRRSQVL